jgi:hypothetical protein
MPKIQAHEYHSGISETSSEVLRVPSGHRAFEPRIEACELGAQASELNNLETHRHWCESKKKEPSLEILCPRPRLIQIVPSIMWNPAR